MFGKVFVLFFVLGVCVGISVGGELQDMIDSASVGSTLKVDGGVYKESLLIDKDIKLVGSPGREVVISPVSFPLSCAVMIQGDIKVSFEGIIIDLSGAGKSLFNVDGIKADGVELELKDCVIKGAIHSGATLLGCKTVIKDCKIVSNGKHGVELFGGSLEIEGCTISKNASSGIYGHTVVMVDAEEHDNFEYRISDNIFVGNKNGIYIDGYCKGKADKNYIIDNSGSGIFIRSFEGRNDIFENTILRCDYSVVFEMVSNKKNKKSTIKNNQCSNSNRGIYVKGKNSIVDIEKNECNQNKVSGITVDQDAKVNILNNTCNDNGGQGVYLFSLFDDLKVEGNECNRNKLNGIYITGGGAEVKKNICNYNTNHGICFDYCAVDVERNECLGNNRSGLYFQYYVDGSAKKNSLKNNGHYGIVRGSTVLLDMEKNEMRGNRYGNIQQTREVSEEVRYMLMKKDFEKLERIARDLRENRRRDLDGDWKTKSFYSKLSGGWAYISLKHAERAIGILDEWMKEYPESVAPYVVLADLYINVAWKHRGNGWGNEVTAEGWQKFNENLKLAVEVIRKGEKLQEKDAHLYSRLIKIGMALSEPDLRKEGFEKGVAINKYYAPLYYETVTALLPRWGGKEGELEAFADKVYNQEKDMGGAILYARIAHFTYRYTQDRFGEFEFSYDKIKRGCEGLLKRYPESRKNLNSYCLLACLYDDKEKAKELFKKIGRNRSGDIWFQEGLYEKYYKWALGVDPPK